MNIKKTTIAIALVCGLYSHAQSGFNNPMTQAIMNVYQQHLVEDPTDYDTYYRRANEYYKYNQYSKALSDINNALKYTPSENVDMRVQSLILRANIYILTGKKDFALVDLTEAIALSPTDYSAIYQRANLEYDAGKYQEAKADFQRMQRLNNRSVEALIGLARVAVKENNIGLANEYIDQAVALAPTQSEVYVRRASVRQLMGNDNGAVEDLIIAISTDNNNTKALQQLVTMSDTKYTAVITGLSDAIRQAPNVGMFYYIRAVIAEKHFNYLAALTDYKHIVDYNLYNYTGLYNSIAKCYYALGYYEEALSSIDYAIASTTDNGNFYVTKACIERARGHIQNAYDNIVKATSMLLNQSDAMIEKALILVDLGMYDEATALVGEAMLNDAENNYYTILRAWILSEKMKQQGNATNFYNRVIDNCIDTNNVKSFVGFAYLALEEKEKAIQWMENVLATNTDYNGSLNYYATCFYAQTGDFDKALSCMDKALNRGYANYFDWTKNNDTNINISPLRNDPRFNELLTKYMIIFTVSD